MIQKDRNALLMLRYCLDSFIAVGGISVTCSRDKQFILRPFTVRPLNSEPKHKVPQNSAPGIRTLPQRRENDAVKVICRC